MRPAEGGGSSSESPPRRKQSITGTSPNVASAAPTSFFIASESMMNTPTASMSDTTFGVRSFSEEEPAVSDIAHDKEESRRRSTIIAPRSLPRDLSKDSLSMGSFGSSSGGNSNGSSPARAFERPRIDTANATDSKVPLSLSSPMLGVSEPSSPKSTSISSSRPSDDENMDDRSSQAVMSDSEEESAPVAAGITSNTTAPQFIMPSIMMPSRRPFSDKGMAIGRLKILLAGASGLYNAFPTHGILIKL